MANPQQGKAIKHKSILGRQTSKFEKDKPRRLQFGLGLDPLNFKPTQGGIGLGEAAQKCIKCSFGNIPVIEEVVWTIPLPLTSDEALSVFGDVVNLLSGSSSVPGVASIDSTFLINGILQTDILAQGIGVHVFCEPMSFSTIGNAWEAPDSTTTPPPSPDVFTANDVEQGAMGDGVASEENPQTFVPAVFEFGAPVWRAGWNFINAYQFVWKTSQRELVLNELAADVSYFGAFADAMASGTSEVPIIEFVAAVNAHYRSKGSGTIFLPVNFRRVGSVTTAGPGGANIGIFHPTRDFDLAPVTWGGLRFQGYGCKGQMYRPIESPCFIERGIPVGMLFQSQDAVHQALMMEALTIDNDPLGTNVSIDENVSDATIAAANVMDEQTLDADPVLEPQSINTSRQIFKGGILKIGIKIKGWEMPGGWKAYCATNLPEIMGPKAAG